MYFTLMSFLIGGGGWELGIGRFWVFNRGGEDEDVQPRGMRQDETR
jgi:hypothetical protein